MEPNVHITRGSVPINNNKIKSVKACYTTCNNALIYTKCATLTIHNHHKALNKIDNLIFSWRNLLNLNSFTLCKNRFLKINSVVSIFILIAKSYRTVIKHFIMWLLIEMCQVKINLMNLSKFNWLITVEKLYFTMILRFNQKLCFHIQMDNFIARLIFLLPKL